MRETSFIIGVVASAAASFAITVAADEPSASVPPAAAHLEAILNRGLDRRIDIADVESEVARLRGADPEDPVFDYALGLFHLKRLQNDAATDKFLAALKVDPTHLPARQAMFRLRLTQKDLKALCVEIVDFAADIGSSDVRWRDDRHRSEAAALLGRVIGYLGLPDTKLIDSTTLEATRTAVEQKLGPKYADFLSDGLVDFTAEYCALQTLNEQKAEEATERQQFKVGASVERLQKRSTEAGRTTETLKLSKQELKTKLNKEMKDADQQLKKLKDDHTNISSSAMKADKMIRQTRVDIARLETELDLRGFRGRELRLQPPLVQLQQELSKHQRTFADLESRAGELSQSIREAHATREEVVARQERDKQDFARRTEAAEKWKQVVSRRSQKVKLTATTDRRRTPIRRRPVTVQQLFPLDFKAESARLLHEYRLEPPAEPQTSQEK